MFKSTINYKQNPDEYKYTTTTKGIGIVKPYKDQIEPHIKLGTQKEMEQTGNKLCQMFNTYLKRNDFIGADMIRKYVQKYSKSTYTKSRANEVSRFFWNYYDDMTNNDDYLDWVETKLYLQKRPQFKSFIEMHKKLKMPGSYRKGLVAKDGKITRLIINYHTTSPDEFDPDFKNIYYAGRGKKGKDYKRIVDQISNKQYYEENQTIIKHNGPFPVYAKFWFLKNAYFLGNYKYKSHVIKKNGKVRYYFITLTRGR